MRIDVLACSERFDLKAFFKKTTITCLLLSAVACAPTGSDFGAETSSYDDSADAGLDALDDKALSVTYQAEKHTGQSGCVTSTAHTGYSGAGFVDYGGNGTWIEWNNVSISEAGEYSLTLKYANGSAGNRQMAVVINGKSVGNLAFAPTGRWSTWKTVTTKVTLRAGANTIRVMANTSAGGPNLDSMTLVGGSTGGGSSDGGSSGGGSGSGAVRDLDFVSFHKLANEVTTFNNVTAQYVVYAESHGREGHNDIRNSQPGFVGMKGATLVGYGGGRDKYLAIFKVNSSTVVVDKDQGNEGRGGGSAQALFIKTAKTLSVTEARSLDPAIGSERVPGTKNSSEIVIYAEDEGGKGTRDEFFMPKAYKVYGSGDDLLYVFAQSLSGGPTGNGAFMRLTIR
jgi:hypothetical protein